LIFQVISRRYEKKSLVLTTNLAFADWHTIFPSATCATALVERVVHHADIVKIEGESYRLRESQVDATARGNSRRDGTPRSDPASGSPAARRTPPRRAAPFSAVLARALEPKGVDALFRRHAKRQYEKQLKRGSPPGQNSSTWAASPL
jgi:hypothetical protein